MNFLSVRGEPVSVRGEPVSIRGEPVGPGFLTLRPSTRFAAQGERGSGLGTQFFKNRCYDLGHLGGKSRLGGISAMPGPRSRTSAGP